MFFAPPKVRSLSRYAEFGIYLGHKDFMAMLAAAIFMHAVIIGVYLLTPREEVVRIPVRVLNIKLAAPAKDTVEMPGPEASAPVVTRPQITREQSNVRPTKPEQHHETPPEPEPLKPAASSKHVDSDAHPKRHERITSHEYTLSTPKKYVREGDVSGAGRSGKRSGNSTGAGSATGLGSNPVERYEQTISLWVARHRVYPAAAIRQGIEGNAVVRVRIDRMGHLLYSTIDQTSGNAVIDQAVLAMVQESNPVPPVPSDYPPGSQLEFLIPVSYHLK